MAEFKLSASLQGHEDDVRGVIFASPTSILSCSRDTTVRFWNLTQPSPPVYDDTIAFQGSAFINAVTYIAPTTEYPAGLVVSGGKDAIIDIRQPGRPPDANAERMLLGHQGNICALDVSPAHNAPARIVSGSWDSSAQIWDIERGESVATLEGHGAAVWGVLWYDQDTIITACADQHIRIFSTSGKLHREFKASSEVVRALCRLDPSAAGGAAFASAGNDGIIRLWTLDGAEVAQLHGHENFIYTLTCLPSGEIVSSSEDRTVRVWKDGQCVQTITHPAISVWSVAASQNGDIVTGASDRTIRVFSKSPDRAGSEATIKAFEDDVKGSAIPKQAMGEINKDQLPGPDFLTTKSGTKEGQVQMIREANGNVSAHTWSSAANQWINVGTVVDAAGSSGRRTEFMGKDYDYVFDVDIEEGKPPLKLPFNVSQNPYEVAQQWIANNELPMTYIDQVANFIITNTQGATLGQATSQGPGADPWGSDKRYRPEDGNNSAPTPAAPRAKVLPQKDYLTITTASFTVIQKKLLELNEEVLKEGRKDIALNPSVVEQFPAFIKELEASASSPKSSPSLDALSDAVITIVTAWPDKMRLPGLDLLRCLANASVNLTQQHDLVGALQQSEALTNGNANTTMLAIRVLANLFGNTTGQQYAASNFKAIHALVVPHMQPTAGAVNRNVQIALTTLYINMAVQLTTSGAAGGPAEAASRAATLLGDLTVLLNNSKIVDSETVYRALVAIGTLLRVPPAEGVQVDGVAIERAVKRATGSSKEPRIKGLAQELELLL